MVSMSTTIKVCYISYQYVTSHVNRIGTSLGGTGRGFIKLRSREKELGII